jgi:hypothetical protein
MSHLKLIQDCILDLNRMTRTCSTTLLLPFYYHNNNNNNNSNVIESDMPSPYSDDSIKSLEYKDSYHWSVDGVVSGEFISFCDWSEQTILDADFNVDSVERNYFYQNCIVDLLLRLYGRTVSNKYSICRLLVDMMPFNGEIIKLMVHFSSKINSLKQTLQTLYDHLSIHSIGDEHLWIL